MSNTIEDYTTHFNSAEDFLEKLNPTKEPWLRKRQAEQGDIGEEYEVIPDYWIFRGQPLDIDPGLKPSALRNDTSSSDLSKNCIRYKKNYLRRKLEKGNAEEAIYENRLQVGAEFDLLRDFCKAADWQGRKLPRYTTEFRDRLLGVTVRAALMKIENPCPWPNKNYFELLALAQHYEVPTRLLDWTEKSYIAAYFAAEMAAQSEYNPKHGEVKVVVWALNTRFIKKFPYGISIEIINPIRANNPNLAAQRGLFTLVTDSEIMSLDKILCLFDKDKLKNEIKDIKDSLKNEMESMIDDGIIKKFTLARGKAGILLQLLYEIGYHSGTLKPSLSGAAGWAKERTLWPDHPKQS
ncbi:MAG: FRG domain-containing protein [Candidatus Alcyoniella australis]|nr:FRG domain-containing protein [Candidatus Alcyoniella australis]